MAWGVDLSNEMVNWMRKLEPQDRARMARQIDKLRTEGPTLGRPDADTLSGRGRHRNMKELRIRHSPLRALFAFGPDRRAIVLVGGSKAGKGKRWYAENVRIADNLLDEHLRKIGREGTCRGARAGRRSAGRSM